MKAGAIVKDVYNAIVQKVRDEKPDLEQYFVKTLGFAVGGPSPALHLQCRRSAGLRLAVCLC